MAAGVDVGTPCGPESLDPVRPDHRRFEPRALPRPGGDSARLQRGDDMSANTQAAAPGGGWRTGERGQAYGGPSSRPAQAGRPLLPSWAATSTPGHRLGRCGHVPGRRSAAAPEPRSCDRGTSGPTHDHGPRRRADTRLVNARRHRPDRDDRHTARGPLRVDGACRHATGRPLSRRSRTRTPSRNTPPRTTTQCRSVSTRSWNRPGWAERCRIRAAAARRSPSEITTRAAA